MLAMKHVGLEMKIRFNRRMRIWRMFKQGLLLVLFKNEKYSIGPGSRADQGFGPEYDKLFMMLTLWLNFR